jgi:hypothetical protein
MPFRTITSEDRIPVTFPIIRAPNVIVLVERYALNCRVGVVRKMELFCVYLRFGFVVV